MLEEAKPTLMTDSQWWSRLLERPIAEVGQSSMESCPLSEPKRLEGTDSAGVGEGPVYIVLGRSGPPSYVIELAYAVHENGWYYFKILWLIDESYSGPVLIRGQKMASNMEMRFDQGTDPSTTLRMSSASEGGFSFGSYWNAGFRERPSHIRIREPGCYVVQMDGTDFSNQIILEISFKS